MIRGDQRTRAPVLLVIALLLIGLRGLTAHAEPMPTSQARSESAGEAQAYQYMVPRELDDGWQTATLESVGMDTARIEQMTNAIRHYADWNIHAILIERDGRLVYEEYFAGEDQRWGRRPLGRVQFDRQTKHDIRSVTKSVISALVGIAVAGGAIPSIDQPIVDFFPEHADLATPEWRRVTVRHALTMSAGLAWEELGLPYSDPRNGEIRMTTSDDPIRYVLSRPIVTAPGATWNYNGGLTHLLGAIVQRSTGQPLQTYTRTVLFQPLGIEDVDWDGDLKGMPSAASGLRLRARDLAKFGSLYLHDGRWRDHQIVPAGWIHESTRRHLAVRNPVSAYGSHGYGYHWWQDCYRSGLGTFEASVAAGNGQQRIYVLPALGMVVTVLAGRYNDPGARWLPERLLLEHILPALPMPANAGFEPEPAGCATGPRSL